MSEKITIPEAHYTPVTKPNDIYHPEAGRADTDSPNQPKFEDISSENVINTCKSKTCGKEKIRNMNVIYVLPT